MPKTWTEDPQRCDKAGIPTDQRQYRTKPELALEMVQEMEGEIAYSWVGGDSIYGNSKTLRQGLQQLEKLFVMDVSEDLLVFVEAPARVAQNLMFLFHHRGKAERNPVT